MSICLFWPSAFSTDPRTFEVSVSQSSYQEKENDNVTLEWTFTTSTNTSSNPLYVLCKLITHHKGAILYQLHESMEIPESQGQQFSGRVHCDKDVLGEGRIRLHLSRLRTEDAGWYVCSVWTNYGSSSKECKLVVSGELTQQKSTGMSAVICLFRVLTISLQKLRGTLNPKNYLWNQILGSGRDWASSFLWVWL